MCSKFGLTICLCEWISGVGESKDNCLIKMEISEQCKATVLKIVDERLSQSSNLVPTPNIDPNFLIKLVFLFVAFFSMPLLVVGFSCSSLLGVG